MTDKEIEAVLTAACEEVIKHGWKIVSGDWVDVNNKCCCPYGAAMLVNNNFDEAAMLVKSAFNEVEFTENDYPSSYDNISEAAGIPYIPGFVATFDGDEDDITLIVPIAVSLRKRYIDGNV